MFIFIINTGINPGVNAIVKSNIQLFQQFFYFRLSPYVYLGGLILESCQVFPVLIKRVRFLYPVLHFYSPFNGRLPFRLHCGGYNVL